MIFAERNNLHLNREYFLETQIFGFDHDGVMARSRQAAVDEYNLIAGTKHTVDDITTWTTMVDWAMEDLGFSKEEAFKFQDEIWYHRPDILFKAKPNFGAKELTQELALRGRPFYIITSRPKEFAQSTYNWYWKHMPWISRSQIKIRKTDEMDGEIYKAWSIDRLGVTVFFEDAIHQAKTITTYTDAHVILLNNGPAHEIPNKSKIIQIRSYENNVPTIQEAEKYLFRG